MRPTVPDSERVLPAVCIGTGARRSQAGPGSPAADVPPPHITQVAKHAGSKGSALDCGCAVGGATFELAKTFKVSPQAPRGEVLFLVWCSHDISRLRAVPRRSSAAERAPGCGDCECLAR